MMLTHKANVLRRYEVYGDRVAYYLLENESLALETTKLAFVELFQDHEFFGQSNLKQKQKVKQALVKQSFTAAGRFTDK